jgi:hypothetical protein
MEQRANPDRIIGYPLRWPASLAERASQAANARYMSVNTWLRQAALEKIERDAVTEQGQRDG